MIGTLFINGKDAYTTWGITLGEGSLSALMTPATIKAPVENKGRGADGKQVLGLGSSTYRPKLEDRELTLSINLSAKDEEEFFRRYASFCRELEGGVLDIKTKYQPEVVYHCIYISCAQFSQLRQGVASFALRLCEPNPRNRA